jgi:hypothetical protein
MRRYKVPVNIYVNSEDDLTAEELVTQMMCGAELMSKMWDVGDAEFKWEDESES